MKGSLIIISAPAGTGKTTLVNMLKKRFPDQLMQSISCTTRKPRKGEVDGKDYVFLTPAAFEERVHQGEFLEHATVFGERYGTSKEVVAHQQDSGKSVILVIDTQGALELKEKVEALFIFIAPPSFQALEERLRKRNTESPESLDKRLKWAEHEMKQAQYYDHTVINEDLECACAELVKIIMKEKDNKGETYES